MAMLLTPKDSRFDQSALDKAVEMAESLIKVEQEIRIGETGERQPDGKFDEISPMKYFIFDKMGEVYPIWGTLFGKPQYHPNMDSKAQIALLVKILVNVLDSRVVLHITEGWSAKRCHNCGEEYSRGVYFGKPCECGAEKCQPRENPHSTEILLCNVAHFTGHETDDAGHPKFGGYSWVYEILRDSKHKITGFNTVRERMEGGIGGRMSEHWILQDYEVPELLINYPDFCDAMGVVCPPQFREMAKVARDSMPKGYPLLTWGIHSDIHEVAKVLQEQHKKTMAKFN